MITKDIRFINPTGLHSRPCATFSKMVKRYSCKVTLIKQDKTADGRSMLALMKLGVVVGDQVTLTCEGEEEQQASEALGNYLATLVEETP